MSLYDSSPFSCSNHVGEYWGRRQGVFKLQGNSRMLLTCRCCLQTYFLAASRKGCLQCFYFLPRDRGLLWVKSFMRIVFYLNYQEIKQANV